MLEFTLISTLIVIPILTLLALKKCAFMVGKMSISWNQGCFNYLIAICLAFHIVLMAGCSTPPVDTNLVPEVVEQFLARLLYYIDDHPECLTKDSKWLKRYMVKTHMKKFIEKPNGRNEFEGQFSASVKGILAKCQNNRIEITIPPEADVLMKIEGTKTYELQIIEADFLYIRDDSIGFFMADGATVVLNGYRYKFNDHNWLLIER